MNLMMTLERGGVEEKSDKEWTIKFAGKRDPLRGTKRCEPITLEINMMFFRANWSPTVKTRMRHSSMTM